MKNMKKILLVILLIFTTHTTYAVNEEEALFENIQTCWYQAIYQGDWDYTICVKKKVVKNLILKKRDIEDNIKGGKIYIKSIDAHISKVNSTDIKILLKRLKKVRWKIWSSEREKDMQLLIQYIEYKSHITLLNDKKNIYDGNIFTLESEDFNSRLESMEYEELREIFQSIYWEVMYPVIYYWNINNAYSDSEMLEVEISSMSALLYIEYMKSPIFADLYLEGLKLDAKNARTTNSISKVATVIENNLIMWQALEDLIIVDIEMTNKYASYFPYSKVGSYLVWKPNYSALWIKSEDYQDSHGNELMIWFLTHQYKYEILWFLASKWNKNEARIIGNYNPRNYALIAWIDYKIWEWSSIVLLKTSNINRIKTKDIVNGKYTVLNTSRDWMTITFDQDVSELDEIVYDEAPGLIFNPQTWEPYENWDIIND